MFTATNHPTRFHLTTIALWPFSIALLFIALHQFILNGTLPTSLTALWGIGVLTYWLFVSTGLRMITTMAYANARNLLQATLIVGGLIYTVVFLLIAFNF